MRKDELYEHFKCPDCGKTWEVYAPYANDPTDPIPTINQRCEECASELEAEQLKEAQRLNEWVQAQPNLPQHLWSDKRRAEEAQRQLGEKKK